MKSLRFALLFTCGLLVGIQAGSTFAQGVLTPPGAPTPTMKTLDQVQPRIPISNAMFVIAAPGSYYLTTNIIGLSSQSGIIISSDNVAIDLNGFSLLGQPGSVSGVVNGVARTNIQVRNGVISGWTGGGVYCGLAKNSRFENLCVANNSIGINAGPNCTVENCSVFTNSSGGISVGDNSQILGCTSSSSGGTGISASQYCQVLRCLANFNSSGGINVGYGSSVEGCTVGKNGGDGISASDDCRVMNNHCVFNSIGIHMSGSYSRIEGNDLADNTSRGIKVELGSGVLVIRNSVNGSSTNSFNIPSGNLVGPILGTAASILTNSNPHANFAY